MAGATDTNPNDHIRLHLCFDLILEEVHHGVGGDGEEGVVHRDADALLATAQAEAAGQFDLVAQIILADELLQVLYDLTGTLDVTGTADTYRDFHI